MLSEQPQPAAAQVGRDAVRVSGSKVPAAAFAEAHRLNEELAGTARVLVRASGTEPLVRVLGEAETDEDARNLCARIAELVRRELG